MESRQSFHYRTGFARHGPQSSGCHAGSSTAVAAAPLSYGRAPGPLCSRGPGAGSGLIWTKSALLFQVVTDQRQQSILLTLGQLAEALHKLTLMCRHFRIT